jgi:hypothetical protein
MSRGAVDIGEGDRRRVGLAEDDPFASVIESAIAGSAGSVLEAFS